jgi:hypothetical protein
MATQISNSEIMPTDTKKWSVALLLAMLIGVSSLLYILFSEPNASTLQKFSFASAAVASFLYATSLSLGSISYYIHWPNMKAGYQKQIGVLAYFVSLVYCLTLIILYPELYWTGIPQHIFSADVIFGFLAMAIFTTMTVINSALVAPYFSWDTIKFVLGLGYVGYAFLAIRAIYIEWPLWEMWLRTFEGYPPGRMVLAFVAIIVLLLRVSIPVHKSLFSQPVVKS